MPDGPGLYGEHTKRLIEETGADLVALIVLRGAHGSGFDVASAATVYESELPDMLEWMAREIRRSLKERRTAN